MKFKITKSAFFDGLKRVQNIISGKSSIAILQNVKLEAKGDELEMVTTDLDITVKSAVICETDEEGVTTLPVKLLFAAISKADEGVIEVEVDESERAVIKSGKARYKINGRRAEDFPQLAEEEDNLKYTISKAVLQEMIRKTSYATSQDDTRRALKGILFSFRDGKLTMVATDGRRMAMVEHEMEFPVINEKDIIIPSKTVSEIVRSLGGEGDAVLSVRASNICFESEKVKIYSKLIDDTYPNYRLVIPKETPNVIQVDRQAFVNALERASVMSIDEARSTVLDFSDNVLTVSSGQSDIGEVKDEVPIKYVGERIEAKFNPVYIMDCLKAIDDDEITLKISNGHTPVIITCSIPFVYVLMPLRQK